MENLQASDIIQLVTLLVTTITAITSIIISVKALKQTSKSIEDANRPYIVIYHDFIQVQSSRSNYLIIKNFGKSSAIIDSITYSNTDFYENKTLPFENLKKCSIAPGQTFITTIKLTKEHINFDVTIKYHTNSNKFTETFSFNTKGLANQLVNVTTFSNQSELEKTISTAAVELIRKNL
ncbi:hypothetical protein [Clostridium perfringens]|uniref:hypothetical protein n=1 Tax=Clostridium perfringens TaxID=1502 RepID=UPI002AC503BB|nr:hypothetical protein [Clostridium perfringens]